MTTTEETQIGPLLGLATTREMLVELECRFRMEGDYGSTGLSPFARIARTRVQTLLTLTPPKLLDYRTVDFEQDRH